jgi:hypothetical protein
MRTIGTFQAVAAGLFALTLVATPGLAQTAACQQSCTAIVKKCVAMGGRGCEADMANCMSTGNLHMPSGRTFSNLCRK